MTFTALRFDEYATPPVFADDLVWPKQYTDMQPPLPPAAVRLLVLPLEESPALASAAAAAAAKIANLLPQGTKASARSLYLDQDTKVSQLATNIWCFSH